MKPNKPQKMLSGILTYMTGTPGRRSHSRILELLLQSRMMKVFVLVVTVAIAIAPVHAELGDQKIVKDYIAAKGWTHIVPMYVNKDVVTDLLSYNGMDGRAIVSVGEYCDFGPK